MGKIKVSVAGHSRCPFFQKAGNVAASLEHIFPDQFQAEIVELEDAVSFKAWLPKIQAQLPGSDKHGTSPLVWIDDSVFIGGSDSFLEWSRKRLCGSPYREVTSVKMEAADVLGKYDYDLLVIGGGSGGLACSKAAAELDAKVALLDFVKPSPHGTTWGLGGTCVNVGCIPKKLFHHAACAGEGLHDAASFGWGVNTDVKHDWSKLVEGVTNYIRSLNFGYKVALHDKNVKYLNKLGSFVDAHTVKCIDKKGKEENVTAARVLIAVGGRPKMLDCEGGELAINSDDIFYLDKAPGKTLVIGASYVALECASFLVGFGYDTTVMVRSILLRGFDQQMAGMVGKAMEKLGCKFIRPTVPQKLEKTANGRIKVYWDGGEDVYDTVLSAVGREADLAALDLENVPGLEPNAKGKLDTVHMQTSNPTVFAIGDCVQGVPELTPVAIELGRNLAERLYGNKTEPVNMNYVPTAVFTGLEYSCVGMSEDDAIKAVGKDGLEVYHSYFTPLQWTIPDNREFNQCYCKVLVNKSNDLVIGIHLLSPESGEIVQAYSVAIKMGMTFEDLRGLIGIHPTIGEEICLLSTTKAEGGDALKSGC